MKGKYDIEREGLKVDTYISICDKCDEINICFIEIGDNSLYVPLSKRCKHVAIKATNNCGIVKFYYKGD